VIQVRVREENRVDFRNVEGERVPVSQPQVLDALKESAIDENFQSTGFDKSS
jgi:hypothetical protein